MTLRIGEMAPDFAAQTTRGDIRFYDWMGDSWAVLLTYPRDINAACAAEIRTVESFVAGFERRGCRFIGLCVEPLGDVEAWGREIAGAIGQMPSFPIAGDEDLRVAALYGAVPTGAGNASVTRSLVVIGRDKRVKLVVAYPMATASIFDEVLRLIESLQAEGKPQPNKIVNWRRNGAACGNAEIDDLGIPRNGKPKRHVC